jgi:hypothetical protein
MSGLNVTIDGTVIPHFQNMQLRRSTKQYAINIETSGRRSTNHKTLGIDIPSSYKRKKARMPRVDKQNRTYFND